MWGQKHYDIFSWLPYTLAKYLGIDYRTASHAHETMWGSRIFSHMKIIYSAPYIIDKLSIHKIENFVQGKQGWDTCSCGSPRPWGYVHQFVIHFIALSK